MDDNAKQEIQNLLLAPSEEAIHLSNGGKLLYTEISEGHRLLCALSISHKGYDLNPTEQNEILEWLRQVLRESTRRGLGVLIGGPRIKIALVGHEVLYVYQWEKVKIASALKLNNSERAGMKRWLEQVRSKETEDKKLFSAGDQAHRQAALF